MLTVRASGGWTTRIAAFERLASPSGRGVLASDAKENLARNNHALGAWRLATPFARGTLAAPSALNDDSDRRACARTLEGTSAATCRS